MTIRFGLWICTGLVAFFVARDWQPVQAEHHLLRRREI
jgi:hypothetical protein